MGYEKNLFQINLTLYAVIKLINLKLLFKNNILF